ncbi:MAG: beta-propeller domain-containing protein [Oscillospiraceae bacterium]|nr:beta-propeller domain-containing protein [Oscillospiraceae bacterium]
MKKDKRFIKDKLLNGSIDLPEGLKKESIVSLIENETQTKPKKKNYAPFVLSAAAAVIVIIAGVILGNGSFGKTPEVNIPQTSVSPETVQKSETDYSELSKILSANKENLYSGGYFLGGSGYFITNEAADFDAAVNNSSSKEPSASAPTAAENSGSGDYSSLNTRTEGVDEADVMKTDGKYIYALKSDGWNARPYCFYSPYSFSGGNQTFAVFDKDLNKKGEILLTTASKTDADICQKSYTGFFLYNDYVIFTGIETTYSGKGISYNEKEQYWDILNPEKVEAKTVSLVSIYDMSDKADIKPLKDLYFSGSILSSRISDGKLIAVSSYYPNYSVFNEKDYTTFVPLAGEKDEYVSAENIKVLDDEEGNFTTVSLIDLNEGEFKVNSVSLLGQAWELYCSGENVYTYGVKSRYRLINGWFDVLNINKINISAALPEYIATAEIEGASLNDSFSIDEFDGFLRIAVDDGAENCCRVIVYDENMKKAGNSAGFAEGEYIRSARFMGNTAYIVTFRNTDPLFVIDLSDPAKPVIKGEVSLPGFSAYLHPVGKNHLVGIGYDGTEDGLNGGAKISLFDISDPENPLESDNFTLPSASLDCEYKDFVKKGSNGYIVNFYDYSKDRGSSGALYFTAENGKIKIETRINAGNGNINIIKTIFIENTVYFLIMNYETGEYELASFDLISGESIAKAKLG